MKWAAYDGSVILGDVICCECFWGGAAKVQRIRTREPGNYEHGKWRI